MEIECVCVYIFLGGEDDMMIYVLCHVNVEKMCRFAKKINKNLLPMVIQD